MANKVKIVQIIGEQTMFLDDKGRVWEKVCIGTGDSFTWKWRQVDLPEEPEEPEGADDVLPSTQ